MQTFIDAWQKGLSALTHQSSYDKKIVTGFKGNAFDFIEIPAIDSDLAYVAVMIPYFATFFFDTPSNAEAFEDLIESISQKHSRLNVCSINHIDRDRMSKLVKYIQNLILCKLIFHFTLN